MHDILTEWADALLAWIGMNPHHVDGWDRWVVLLLVTLFVVLVDTLMRGILVRAADRIVRRTRATWDDEFFNPQLVGRSCRIVSVLLLIVLLPIAFEEHTEFTALVMRLVRVYLIYTVLRFILSLLHAAFNVISQLPSWENKPINGLRQTAQGIAFFLGAILIIAELIGKSPTILLTGLGASAAVMMLIFKDSILGFVSGIQLSANDMVKVGDWISMPKYGADGYVEEVSLTTVKIRNFDKTIVTLPPYLLVSDSFQNWRGMQQSGGRRVKRSVAIDMTSVRFCTPEMLDRYRKIDLIRDYVDRTEAQVEHYNESHGIDRSERRINGLHQTNLGIFRAYLERYLRNETTINQEMTLMVRQLQPTAEGLPMELYFFTDTVVWTEYEKIQADIFDHVLAAVPEFDLRVFQTPSGSDVRSLCATSEQKHQ